LLLQVNAWAVKGRDDDIWTEATCTCVYTMRLCESFVTIVIIRILDDKLPFQQGCFMHGATIGGVEATCFFKRTQNDNYAPWLAAGSLFFKRLF
jgi:hypothetical protein